MTLKKGLWAGRTELGQLVAFLCPGRGQLSICLPAGWGADASSSFSRALRPTEGRGEGLSFGSVAPESNSGTHPYMT